jgi:hypothetical protein
MLVNKSGAVIGPRRQLAGMPCKPHDVGGAIVLCEGSKKLMSGGIVFLSSVQRGQQAPNANLCVPSGSGKPRSGWLDVDGEYLVPCSRGRAKVKVYPQDRREMK